MQYKENQVVQFNYNGGHNPGGKRTLFVTDVDSNTVAGIDLEARDFRRFSFNKIDSPVGLKTNAIANKGDSNLIPSLTNLLKANGYPNVFTHQDLLVGYQEPPQPAETMYGRFSIGYGDKTIVVDAHSMRLSVSDSRNTLYNGKVSVKELITQLQALLK